MAGSLKNFCVVLFDCPCCLWAFGKAIVSHFFIKRNAGYRQEKQVGRPLSANVKELLAVWLGDLHHQVVFQDLAA
jgi:hypothetical protein